jgi:hypothetical protein
VDEGTAFTPAAAAGSGAAQLAARPGVILPRLCLDGGGASCRSRAMRACRRAARRGAHSRERVGDASALIGSAAIAAIDHWIGSVPVA